MTMDWKAKWICPQKDMGDICPLFSKSFTLKKELLEAKLYITALGVYEATLNGTRVGEFIMAPGWTAYQKRLQYQEYNVTSLLKQTMEDTEDFHTGPDQLSVIVGKGWYRGRLPGWQVDHSPLKDSPAGLLAQLVLTYSDGSCELITSDDSWQVSESCVRFSEIYDGETYDATFRPTDQTPAVVFEGPFRTLIPQQGEEVREQERISAVRILTTPKGETVVDFGQEVTGYVEICLNAGAGEQVLLSHAEVLDKQGNFYTENYRGAKARYHYICKDGPQTYRPKLCFYGFRYIRIDSFPGGPGAARPENFTAIAVYSAIDRTGSLSCSNGLLNRLFDNVLWGQRGNFLDVPTDCPQRDERLGWTGDAQVFVRTACLNFDVERFFTKWLADLAAEQGADGYVGHVIPDVLHNENSSAAWGDAATICPWQVYLAYGSLSLLSDQFDSMCRWVDYITCHTNDTYLWTGGVHYGDWLGLDAPSGSYKGSSREDFIASAFYAYSASLVVKAGKVLGRDVSSYEALYGHILDAFRTAYPEYLTQTECVLAAHFGLAPDCQKAADQLARMVEENGVKLSTGFVGTPYLLHVLSDYGHTSLAYSLLLREDYPSWLYPVTKGATTIWEHWDGIMENGDFWSADMNSFNHYAYGAVADWVYGKAAGISTLEEYPGYERVRIAPQPDPRLDWLKASVDTRYGTIRSEWKKEGNVWRYEITTPVEARIVTGADSRTVPAGSYIFYSPLS